MVARKKQSFTVELRHTRVESVSLTVEAESRDEASQIALQMHEDGQTEDADWNLSEDETEVSDIYLD